ncbi:hypothetical protein SAMN05421812_104421 [Asanoa hainanensis]|uniref:Uncharacterized protein n=1 Tax=Asanoa hainanensis TaxID=560556 RepID=A0A239LLM1_9ACTN|nr:hypothetical protein [Asanoa hainanensis]SNT31265.1 hypothetical protein SAMN05421812_104421 [Asanoa hainanensis]
MDIDAARIVADTVLCAGPVLRPYRAAGHRDPNRWQFGMLMPADLAAGDESLSATAQTECLVEADPGVRLRVLLRFLQVQRRTVYRWLPDRGRFKPVGSLGVDGSAIASCDEPVEHELLFDVDEATLVGAGARHTIRVPGGFDRTELHDAGRALVGQVVRHRRPLCAMLNVSAQPVSAPHRALRLRVWVENRTRAGADGHEVALTTALVASHLILSVDNGAFVSMADPPGWAVEAAEDCANVGLWPVLVGPPGRHDTLLATPRILRDHPGDLLDSAVDELLHLRNLAG